MLFIVVMKCISLLSFLFVRRKILRLYWGGFAICLGNEMPFVATLFACETQNFASHKHGYAIYWGVEMHFVAVFFVRETQDFASLQADAIVVIYGKLHDGMLSKPK